MSELQTNTVYISVALSQNKLLEEKNTVLMQSNVGLEEELRKANATKGQLETYKRQVSNQRPCWLAWNEAWLDVPRLVKLLLYNTHTRIF